MTDSVRGTDDGSTDTAGLDRAIASIEEQEARLVFTRFRNDDAWALGSILVELAIDRGLPVTIDITRGEQQLFHAAMPGTAAHNDVWIRRKTSTVREFGVSSYLVGLRAARGGHSFEEAPWIDPARLAGHGGAFPITVIDVGVVGTVTVSGLPQADDHALAIEGVEAFLAQ
ncbi:heme-degrading domain-containing protein [Marisediminicola senii]|uniref:heme-degrading domain-containing protein n=1 Tax=Marisediminicola senii TaxID=2711233 RepID=UPI0013EBFAC8|nr:heme-degrading domain-containing protein [Marisediminicola senii]